MQKYIKPVLVVKDIKASIEYYKELFNLKLKEPYYEMEGVIHYAQIENENASLGLIPSGIKHHRTGLGQELPDLNSFSQVLAPYIEKESYVNSIFEVAKKLGGTMLGEPKICEYCSHNFIYFKDINGHMWYIAAKDQ